MHAERRLSKVARQVSDLARLEIEIFKERNPRVADCQVAEGTLYLKGVTLRARDASPEMLHSLNLSSTSSPARSSATATNCATAARRMRSPRAKHAPPRGVPRCPPSERHAGLPLSALPPCVWAAADAQGHPRELARRLSTAGCGWRACPRRELSLGHALPARSRAERRRGEEVQDLPEARRADRRFRGRARTRQRRRAARADGRAARAREPRASRSTRCCRSASRSCARRASARWACATSTCS